MRTLRYIRTGACYHITARANHKERLLASPLAKDLFMETLAMMRRKHECLISDFVVMNNHIHLIMEPRGDSTLSGCMKWLLGVYSMSYNRVFKTWGTVWGGRFYSRPIDGLGDMANTIAYIDRNPVRAFLIDEPEDWEWGGLHLHRVGSDEILGPRPPWLTLVAPAHSRLLLAEIVQSDLTSPEGQTPTPGRYIARRRGAGSDGFLFT
jgi:putative transposase